MTLASARYRSRFCKTCDPWYVLSTYDAQGNVIETFYDQEEDRLDRKYSYAYEFDAQGNWIKRVDSKCVTKEGKSFFEPDDVNYRKITYF